MKDRLHFHRFLRKLTANFGLPGLVVLLLFRLVIAAGALHGAYSPFARSWGFFPANDRRATFICYEQLRAMRRGAIMAGVTEDELEKIFWDNACRIYGLPTQ